MSYINRHIRNLMECRREMYPDILSSSYNALLTSVMHIFTSWIESKKYIKEDMKTIEAIKGNSVYKIMPVIMKQIVFY